MLQQSFLAIKTDFLLEGGAERLYPIGPGDLEVERAKVTALPAERNVDVESDIALRLNSHCGKGWDFEKSRSRTISISSSGDLPRLRVCALQCGVRRSESNTALIRSGFMRLSHARSQ